MVNINEEGLFIGRNKAWNLEKIGLVSKKAIESRLDENPLGSMEVLTNHDVFKHVFKLCELGFMDSVFGFVGLALIIFGTQSGLDLVFVDDVFLIVKLALLNTDTEEV